MIRWARIGVVMPAFINDSICPNLKCNIKALDRAKAPIITEKEPVREPEKHLPALYVDAQTKTPAFVFALVALIDFISPLVLSGSNKQSITEANNVNRTIRHFFA